MDYASDKHWENAGIDRICSAYNLYQHAKTY